MNYLWNYQNSSTKQLEESHKLAKELGINPILGKLLIQRGIHTPNDARTFFHPQLKDLHDPFLMKDMDIAVDRLNQAIGKIGRAHV